MKIEADITDQFYKHIFTARSLARQELTVLSNKPKIKHLQAVLNNMTAVTPGSITYMALIVGNMNMNE